MGDQCLTHLFIVCLILLVIQNYIATPLTVHMVRYTVTEKLAAFETFNFAMDPERKRTLKATVVYGGSLSNPFVPRLSHPLIHIFQQVHFPCFHTIKKLI